MKTGIPKTLFLLAVSATFAGCCTEPKSGPPVAEGLLQIGQALANIKLGELEVAQNPLFGQHTNFAVGLFASDFVYTFNVTANKSTGNQLSIDVGAPPQSPVSAKVGGTFSNASGKTSANQITLVFSSPYFTTTTITTTNKQTVGSNTVTTIETKVQRTITDPARLKAFFEVVNGAGITPAFRAAHEDSK